MINKKLDDILKNIEAIIKIFNDTKYFENLEKVIDKQNKFNEKLKNKNEILQERINKALDYIKENSCLDEYNGNIVENYKYELEKILKGDE